MWFDYKPKIQSTPSGAGKSHKSYSKMMFISINLTIQSVHNIEDNIEVFDFHSIKTI